MDQRPPVLQTFLDQLFDAIRRNQTGREPGRCIDRVFTALADYRGRGQNTPARLPACAHLGTALAAAEETHDALQASFAALEPSLTWTRRAKTDQMTPEFFDGHANALIIGPTGYEQRDDVWVGVSLMAPQLCYPDHNHAPEEVYLVLSDSKFQHGEEDWSQPGIGGLFYNTPNIRHAMASGDGPLFAIWCLPVG